MARPRMDDGKRVALSTRVSEERAAELDAARGSLSVSAALDAALGYWLAMKRHEAPAAPARRRRAAPRPVAAAPEPEPVPGVKFEPAAEPVRRARCPHPGTRVIGGWCPQCGVVVQSDGYLP